MCFNRRIQDQLKFQLTENGIDLAETPCQQRFHSMFGRPANARSVVIQNRKPFSNSNRADPSERRQNELDRRKKIEIVKLCTNLMECIYEEP